MVWYGMARYGMVKLAKMLTFEPMVRFSSSFFPRCQQDLSNTLPGLVWFGMVWYGLARYGMVKLAKNANF